MSIRLQPSCLAMAITVASTIAVPPGFADGIAYPALDSPARNQLLSSGVNAGDLTDRQIAEVAAIFQTTDGAADQNATAQAIVERSARNARLGMPAGDSAHAAQMVAGVSRSLGAAGIRDVDAATLSLHTVQRLSAVFSEHDDGGDAAAARAILEEAPRQARLARTIAEVPAAGETARVVLGRVSSLGIRVADPGALTLGQLSQIASVYDLDESASDREAAIRSILDM